MVISKLKNIKKSKFVLFGFVLFFVVALIFVPRIIAVKMEGNACSSKTTTDSDGDGINDACDLCPTVSAKGVDLDLDGCIDGTPTANKEVKVSAYDVISNEATSKVEIGVDASMLMKLRAQSSHSELIVDLPQGAHGAKAYAKDPSYDESSSNSAAQANNVIPLDNIVESMTAEKTQITIPLIPRKDIEITYTLPGPTKTESLSLIGDKKKIKVAANFHYTNVSVTTTTNNQPDNLIRLFHRTEGGGLEVVNNLTYIDTDGDGSTDQIGWVVPHLSTQLFELGLSTAFNSKRGGSLDLPSGWFVQADGQSNIDDACNTTGAWKIASESFTGEGSVMYTPANDPIGCGIKLPTFNPPVSGDINFSFDLKSKFTSANTKLEFVNYGNDVCSFKMNASQLISISGCRLADTNDIGNGWQRLSFIWTVSSANPIYYYISPSSLYTSDNGMMLFDGVTVVLP